MPIGGDVAGETLNIQFTADGKNLVVASDITPTRLWDASDGKKEQDLFEIEDNLDGNSQGLAVFLRDGCEVAATQVGDGIAVFDLQNGKRVMFVKNAGKLAVSLCVATDAKTMIVGQRDGVVKGYQLPSGESQHSK